MYCNKAKKIEIHHANENSEIFKIGENYQQLQDSQIINIEFQQEDNTYTAKFIDIYVEYILKDKWSKAENLQKIHKIFLKYAGGGMLAEIDVKE